MVSLAENLTRAIRLKRLQVNKEKNGKALLAFASSSLLPHENVEIGSLTMVHNWVLRFLLIMAIIFTTGLFGFGYVDNVQRAEKPNGEALPTIQTILEWLPADTEMLMVTKGPFQLDLTGANKAKALANRLEQLSYLPLSRVRKKIHVRKLTGQEVILAVEGARRFRSAKSLGMWPYEGCHVLVFKRGLGSAADFLTNLFVADAAIVQKIGGFKVFSFEEKLEEDSWKFYFVQPKPNILLCGTDKVYLVEMLRRMKRPAIPRAFPAGLPEWKYVNTAARFWAIRHYDNVYSARHWEDPLSLDPQAVGLAFTCNPGVKHGDSRAKVMYLSASTKAHKVAKKAWTFFDQPTWRPMVRIVGAGIVEVTVAIEDKQAAEFFFLLLHNLGHSINS